MQLFEIVYLLHLPFFFPQGTETKSIYRGEDACFDFEKEIVPDEEDEERMTDSLGSLYAHLRT